LPVPPRLVHQVPPQRRELRRRRQQGLGGEQALDFTPDEQASLPLSIALA
jgi:hypothetical protein